MEVVATRKLSQGSPSRKSSTAGRKGSDVSEPVQKGPEASSPSRRTSQASGNWSQGLRDTRTPPRRKSIVEAAQNLNKTETISHKLSGQHTYSRAKAIADEMERMQKELLKINGEDKEEFAGREPVPDVFIPANPNVTATLSFEAQCVRALEYEEAIDQLIEERKLRATNEDLLRKWQQQLHFSSAKNTEQKKEMLQQEFQLIEQILSMFRNELERLLSQ